MVSADLVTKERFVVLDGMRGLAAFAVITDHVASPALTTLLPGRYLAVDFFFVLSGFVLAHVYARRLASGMTFSAFIKARVIRLYPLYLLGAGLGAALALLYALKGWGEGSIEHVLTSILFALFLLPCPPNLSIWPNAPFPLNGPAWSLFFELFVNVIFALVARWLTPVLCLVFMAVGGVLLVPTAFGFGQLDGGFAWDNFIAGFPRVIFGFFTGVWLYHMRNRWRLPALPAWLAFLALFAAFAFPAEGVWRATYDLFAVLVIFPMLVALSAESDASGAFGRAASLLGLLSYGVYVLHVPLWGALSLALDAANITLPGAANVALVALVAGLTAWVLHRTYDAPVRRALTRRLAPASQ